MKKILLSIVFAIAMISLAGCAKDKTSGESSATDSQASVTSAASKQETSVSEEAKLPENAGDFASSDRMFAWDQSSELYNITMGIFPVDDTKAVLQFSYFKGSEDDDIVSEAIYSYTYELVNQATYRNEENGIEVFIDKDGNVTVTAAEGKLTDIEGTYYASGGVGSPAKDTIIEFIRNIPGVDLGDFGKEGSNDEIEEYMTSDWFHEIYLVRDDEIFKSFVATDDMSAICEVEDETAKVIYGSFETTMDRTVSYTVESGDENSEEYHEVEIPVICPSVLDGTDLYVGQDSFIMVDVPWSLTESVSAVSSNPEVVSAEGDFISAVAVGEATLTVDVTVAGCTRQYTIDVNVTENDSFTVENEYVDPNRLTLFDINSERIVMEIALEEGLYSVDIIASDDATTIHHWSYIGELDSEDPSVINLIGGCVIETYNDNGDFFETIISEDQEATVRKDDDGYYYWYDAYEDFGANCKFE